MTTVRVTTNERRIVILAKDDADFTAALGHILSAGWEIVWEHEDDDDRDDPDGYYRWTEMMRKEREAIKAVSCPRCGADAGTKCVTANGKTVVMWSQSHAARLKAAK